MQHKNKEDKNSIFDNGSMKKYLTSNAPPDTFLTPIISRLRSSSRDSTASTTIGATIMKNLEIVHPAAQTMVDIAKSQDSEVD